MKPQQTSFSLIAAVIHVSESEIVKVNPEYDASWEEERPYLFKQLLWDLGLDPSKEYVRFDGLQHRNRLNEVVVCSRWYGHERSDQAWLISGYASEAALDKAKNNRLLDDSYRMRQLTHDAQDVLERRDMYENKEQGL